MIRLARKDLGAIENHARRAWPEEACGLLLGRAAGPRVEIDAVAESANVAADPARRFEIDPKIHIALQRDLRGTSRAVVGVYHSHPKGAAEPSETDRTLALDPDLVWLILALDEAGPKTAQVYRLVAPGGPFAKVPLEIVENA